MKVKVEDVIEEAREAVEKNFLNSDWQEEAEEAAVRIVEKKDIALAKKIARAATQKLPAWAHDDEGRPSVFLYWEHLGVRTKQRRK